MPQNGLKEKAIYIHTDIKTDRQTLHTYNLKMISTKEEHPVAQRVVPL